MRTVLLGSSFDALVAKRGWASFLPNVRVGGALPVTFRVDGDNVIVEVIVPYVVPTRREPADASKISLGVAEGFPVPVSGRFPLPAFDLDTAACILRSFVRDLYHHEIDEQFRVGMTRPFAPDHEQPASPRLSSHVCAHCDARPPRGDYMVPDTIWAKTGVPSRGYLCLSCLDERLIVAGHPRLTLADFPDVPCNAGVRFGFQLAQRGT